MIAIGISVSVGKKRQNRAFNTNRKQAPKQTVQISKDQLKIVLDHSFVHNYLRSHEKVSANESVVIVDDSDVDDSVEYMGTEKASPNTKKMAEMNARIFNLEKENRRLQSELTKKIVEADDGAMAIESNDIQASTSKSASGTGADLGLSLDADMIGQMLDECKEDGNLIDLAKDVMDFCMEQEYQQ